jgi:hypothetical protein
MAHHWLEVDHGDKVVFSDWDPYAEPPGVWVLFVVQVAGGIYPWFALGGGFGELPWRMKVLCPFISLTAVLFCLATFWSLRFVLEVDATGFLLKRACLGVVWLRKSFPADSFVEYLDDLWDDRIEGYGLEISAPGQRGITFGRGKACVAFTKRIRDIAERFRR